MKAYWEMEVRAILNSFIHARSLKR